jgi:uncharacterized protein (DUF1501 family)
MKRRSFLQTTTAAAIGTQVLGGVPLRAYSPVDLEPMVQASDDRILIVIQMFGGNDGLNTIIPADDDAYYAIRPTIAVPKTKTSQVADRLFFHPSLDPANVYNLRKMWDDGRLAVINGIGYENPNLSHFRSTDIWLSGFNSSDPEKRLIDGWLARFFAQQISGFPETLPDHPIAVQIGGSLSMLFQSEKGDVGIALTDPQKFFELGKGLSPDVDPLTGTSRYTEEFNYIRLVAEQSDRYSTVVKSAFDAGTNSLKYEDNGFVKQMQLVARLISGGLRTKVFHVYLGGFDTHVQQQDEDLAGLHPALLRSLSVGIGQFMQDALTQGFADRVVGMTVSEFGRRPFENGSRGTDHGASSVQFVFGNKVRSAVYGNAPDLSNFDSNGDVRYQYDYRRVYADVLQTWFGGTADDVEAVLEDRILPLGVIQAPTTVSDALSGKTPTMVRAYPNPTSGSCSVQWQQHVPGAATVELYGSEGRFISTVHADWYNVGIHNVVVPLPRSGSFLAVVTINGVAHTVGVVGVQ